MGKSTLINSLFLTDLYPERYIPGAAGTGTHTHSGHNARCNNREMSAAAMSPAEHYFSRNAENALVSKYGPALLMTRLRFGLALALK